MTKKRTSKNPMSPAIRKALMDFEDAYGRYLQHPNAASEKKARAAYGAVLRIDPKEASYISGGKISAMFRSRAEVREKRTSKSAGRKPVRRNDRRELMAMIKAFPEGAEIDEARMTVSFELDQDEGEPLDCVLPFKFEVCGTCHGKGSHVNPSIDSHGITASEWEEDWDEDSRESYMSGGYDVPCSECGGQRVVPEIDESRADKKCLDAYHEWAEAEYAYAAQRRHETEMGY